MCNAHIAQHGLHLLRDAYGSIMLDHSEADLSLVQRAVDDGVVSAGQELELQCLVVALGNVWRKLRWSGRKVTNEYGTLLAIHAPRIGFTLYPISMISKRVEDGRTVDVVALYRSFVRDLGLQPA